MEETHNKTEKRTVLFVAGFAAFLTPFLGSAVNLALPSMATDFQADAIQLNWVVSGYLLTSAIFLLPFGRLADQVGRKKIFTLGLLLFFLSTLLLAFSPNYTFLMGSRVVQGIASAMIFGTSMAIISSVFQKGERGKAFGIITAMVYVGLSAGPLLGGILTRYLGWRSIFWILAPIGLLSAWLIHSRVKGDWVEDKGDTFDWSGSLLFGLFLSSLMFGFSKIPEPTGFWILPLSFLLLLLFLYREGKLASNPLIDLRLFRNNRVFTLSNLAAMIHYSSTAALGFFMSLYLQYIQALDSRDAGLILMIQPVFMALFSPVFGRLSDTWQPRLVATSGMALTMAGLLSLLSLNLHTSLWLIGAILALVGIGFALFSSPNTNAIMSSVDKKHYGLASGMVGTMRIVGQMLSMAIAMLLFSIFLGKSEITPELHPRFISGMHTAFIIFSILCALGVFASAARGKAEQTNREHKTA